MRVILALAFIVFGHLSLPFDTTHHFGVLSSLSSLLPALVVYAKTEPERTITYFKNAPAKLHYFDNTTTILYFDGIAGDVYISEDEGKNWDIVDGIPRKEAVMLIEHPFDKCIAFVLTRSTRHHKTADKGRTWRSFDVPTAPVFSFPGAILAFHAEPAKSGYILYRGLKCERHRWWEPIKCHEETFFTKDGFAGEPKLLLRDTSNCIFAHSSKEFSHNEHDDLIFCQAFEAGAQEPHSITNSRLFSSSDFFNEDRRVVDFGLSGRLSRGVMAIEMVSKFLVVALRDLSEGANGEMVLYVTMDSKNWTKAHFPRASNVMLHERSYMILESTTYSLAIDVQSHTSRNIGTLFVSNSNGTYFVEALRDTHRSDAGYVDFENNFNIDGVGLANYVQNAHEIEGGSATSFKLKTVITNDGGSSWVPIKPPTRDMHERPYGCDTNNITKCSLHLHSVSEVHNIGSSTASGFALRVGSVSEYLFPYEYSDTYFSRDGGNTWKKVQHGAHKCGFGDQGSIVVIVSDEEPVSHITYSVDSGESWHNFDIGIKLRAMLLTTIPGSTSHTFVLLSLVSRGQGQGDKRYVIVHLDFAGMRTRQCEGDDLEKWYAPGANGKECIMVHRQWFWRRKIGRDCYIGNKFKDPESHPERCGCVDSNFNCDHSYVRGDDGDVPAGPGPISTGVNEHQLALLIQPASQSSL